MNLKKNNKQSIMKRSEIYFKASQKTIDPTDHVFICNTINQMTNQEGCRENKYPELFLFRECTDGAWFSQQLIKDKFFINKEEDIIIKRINFCKSIALLLCYEMAKQDKN